MVWGGARALEGNREGGWWAQTWGPILKRDFHRTSELLRAKLSYCPVLSLVPFNFLVPLLQKPRT